MQDKCTTSGITAQHIIAGLKLNDSAIEFYGFPETMKVQWIQNGQAHKFSGLSKENFLILANAYNKDEGARAQLEPLRDKDGSKLSYTRRVELYTYFMYGGLDSTPDLKDGTLQACENYRHERDCISLNFSGKKIRLNGNPLKPREIKMIDLMALDYKDTVIAGELNIARGTLNQHKQELYTKAGVHTKPALMVLAMSQKVARFLTP